MLLHAHELVRSRPSLSPLAGLTLRPGDWRSEGDARFDESEDAVEIQFAVPGVAADAIEVEATGRRLTIRATRTVDVPEGYQPLRRERGALRIERSMSVGDNVDLDNITATLAHGVLTVSLPKVAAPQPRRIAVQVGGAA